MVAGEGVVCNRIVEEVVDLGCRHDRQLTSMLSQAKEELSTIAWSMMIV